MMSYIETGMLEYLNSELDEENEYIKKHGEEKRNSILNEILIRIQHIGNK